MRAPIHLGEGIVPAICWAGDRWLVAIGRRDEPILVVSLAPDGTELGRNTWFDGWGFPVLEWPFAGYKGTAAHGWAAILRDIPAVRTHHLTTAHGNAPVALGHGYLLWQHAPAYRVHRLRLSDAVIDVLGDGRPTGLAWVNLDGTPALVDDTRHSVSGMTKPQRAGDCLVGEGPQGGMAVRLGARSGLLLPGQDCMDPRVAAGPGGTYAAVCWGSAGAGVRVQLFTAEDLAAAQPDPEPGPVPVVAPWPRKLWIAPYWSHGRHGDTPIAEHAGNAIWVGGEAHGSDRTEAEAHQILLDRLRTARDLGYPMVVATDGSRVPAEFLDQTIAWYLHGSSVEDLGRQVERALTWPEKPILAYLDGRGWPAERPSWVTDRVWPNVQTYRNPGESLADFDRAIRTDLDRIASWGVFCSITPAFFTRNGAVAPAHIVECMPLYERWVRAYPIVSILPFADRRAHGMVQHPEFRAWARAFLAAAERPSRWDYWQSETADPDFVLIEKLTQTTPNIAFSLKEKARLIGFLRRPGPRPVPDPDPDPQAPVTYGDYGADIALRWGQLKVVERSHALAAAHGVTSQAQINAWFDGGDPRGPELADKLRHLQGEAFVRILGELHHDNGHVDVGLGAKSGGTRLTLPDGTGVAEDVIVLRPRTGVGPDWQGDIVGHMGGYTPFIAWHRLDPFNPERTWVRPPAVSR